VPAAPFHIKTLGTGTKSMSAFDRLHGLQASTRFVSALLPPRETGTTWSTVRYRVAPADQHV
jgi:hypothetical protein